MCCTLVESFICTSSIPNDLCMNISSIYLVISKEIHNTSCLSKDVYTQVVQYIVYPMGYGI